MKPCGFAGFEDGTDVTYKLHTCGIVFDFYAARESYGRFAGSKRPFPPYGFGDCEQGFPPVESTIAYLLNDHGMTGLEVFGVRGGPRLDARSQRCGSWFHYAT